MPTLLELATTTSLLNSSCFNQKLQNRAKFQKSWTNRRLRVHISELNYRTWSKRPRLPISPQKPRQENATMLVIPNAQTSDKTEFPGNITAASEDDVVRLRVGLRISVAGNLELDLKLVVRNRGIGEKKRGMLAREGGESTRGDEMKEQQRTESLVVVAIFCNTRDDDDLFFHYFFHRI